MYAEGLTGALYLDQPHEVDRYEGVFRQMWDMALDTGQAVKLMALISKELEE